jgi:cytohesin
MSVVPLSSVKGPILEDCQTLEEKGDWLSLVQTQQMVRVTVLEVANAAPAQVEAYRREVLELKELIQSYRSDVQALRAAQSQSSTASNPVAPSSPSTESLPASEEGVLVLQPQFETPPKDFWYEGKPFPRFAVRLCTAAGEPWERADVKLAVTMKNGRGLAEERCAKKAGPLLAGETTAVVDGAGVAAWESLRVCEPSSKHYGAFTMVVRAVEAPQGVRVAELASSPLQVQVGRMWCKRRKAEDELAPDDLISQIPGVGAKYVARLKLHGVATVAQFATMAATPAGRDTLARLCKGDNRCNGLNDEKLQAMVDRANVAMRGGAAAAKRARDAPPTQPMPGFAELSEAVGDAAAAPVQFSMDELVALCTPNASAETSTLDGAVEAAFASELATQISGDLGGGAVDDDVLTRRMDILSVTELAQAPPAAAKAAPPPAASGFDALDALEAKAGAAAGFAAWREKVDELQTASAGALGATDRYGCAPLHLAALRGSVEAVAALRGRGADADVNARAARLGDATPLHLAAAVGAEAAASELLVAYAGAFDGRADVSAPMAGGIQPLHLAAWSGAAGLVTELLRERAPAGARTDTGLTALDVAALSGQAACVAILLKAGGGAAAGDAPLTALHCAALHGGAESVRAIVDALPSLASTRAARGVLPTHCCALADDADGLAALLAAGADADAADDDGLTPLHLAAYAGHHDVVRALLAAGADARAAYGGADGVTAAELAEFLAEATPGADADAVMLAFCDALCST